MYISQIITEYEMQIRIGFFIGTFVVIGIWEFIAPKRRLFASKIVRWGNNISLALINSILVRLVFPAAGIGMALFAEAGQWGLFNHYPQPLWIEVIVAVVFLDFVIYLQHLLFHAAPILWRLHQVHHADLDIDVTTGARFHPVEILLSMLIKFAAILLLGPPVLAVLIFEVALNATSMFNHGNIRLPCAVDRILRRLIVTPDMHRVHHSVAIEETNSNFGFNLPWWDRLFGTYRSQPEAGHEKMTIGLHAWRDPRICSQLPGMLSLPFRNKARGYAIGRRDPDRSGHRQ